LKFENSGSGSTGDALTPNGPLYGK